jgi:DNA-binding CsgD family transcriptional regulator
MALIGRESELERLRALVAAAASGAGGVVVLVGEPGIGKTALLDAVTAELAGPSGAAVVRVTGVEIEADLAFGALGIVATALRRLGASLGDPHDAVLEVLAGGTGVSPTTTAAGAAVLAALGAVSASRPIVLVVDDAQWLDEDSSRALAFALRRSGDDPVAALVAARSGHDGGLLAAGFPTMAVGGLDAAAAQLVLGAGTATAVAEACVQATGGNPLALQELGRRLDPAARTGGRPLPAVLPAAGRPVALLRERIEPLDAGARLAAAVLAAAGDGDEPAVVAAVESVGATRADLVAVEVAGVVRIVDGAFLLGHPLLRPAIAEVVGPDAMRQAHRALADALTELPERRAWHLGAAAVGPDDEAADALAAVAVAAAARGATAASAAAWERSAQLTVSRTRREERLLAAGRGWFRSSGRPGVRRVLDGLVQEASSVLVRADAAAVLGDAEGWEDTAAGIAMLVEHAVLVEPLDLERAAVLRLLAAQHCGIAGRHAECLLHAQAAVELGERAGSLVAMGGRCVRAAARQRTTDRAGATEDLLIVPLLLGLPPEMLSADTLPILTGVGLALLFQERWDEADAVLTRLLTDSRRYGMANVSPFAAAQRGELLLRTGRLAEASVAPLEDVLWHHPDQVIHFGHAVLARVEAALGRLDEAEAHGRAAVARAEATSMAILGAFGRAALGQVALLRGDPAGAVAELTPVRALYGDTIDPGELWFQGDLIEALLLVGDRHSADAVVREVATAALSSGSQWGRAVVLRGEGLLERDADRLVASAEVLGAIGAPLEQARSLLLAATWAGRPSAAAEAEELFTQCGASVWAARARDGWRAEPTGPTGVSVVPAPVPAPRSVVPPSSGAGVTDRLSAAELRVALLLAQGRTNREIADGLYLSTKTVETHLGNVYRKLGVKRRAEVVALLSRDRG